MKQCAVVQYSTSSRAYLYEQLHNCLHDVRPLSVHPDHGGHVSHVQVPLAVNQLVEDA